MRLSPLPRRERSASCLFREGHRAILPWVAHPPVDQRQRDISRATRSFPVSAAVLSPIHQYLHNCPAPVLHGPRPLPALLQWCPAAQLPPRSLSPAVALLEG